MNAWSHLPNAAHIDRVVKSVKSHPEIWNAACDAARVAAWFAARDTAWEAGRLAAWDAARDAARAAARAAALNAAWGAARAAILALIAWDDSAEYLKLSGDELEVWARLSDDPRAILLLPAVRAFEKIRKLETV